MSSYPVAIDNLDNSDCLEQSVDECTHILKPKEMRECNFVFFNIHVHKLIRVGIEHNPSCFFYCMLCATIPEFMDYELDKRSECVRDVRAKIASNLSFKNWCELSDGLVALMLVHQKISMNIKKYWERILSVKKADVEYYMCKLLSVYTFEHVLLPDIYEMTMNWENNDSNTLNYNLIELYKYNLKKVICEYFNTDINILTIFKKVNANGTAKRKHIRNYTILRITTLLKECMRECYDEYVNSLHDEHKRIDTYTMGLLSTFFERNIIIIDANTGKPYHCANISRNFNPEYQTVFLLLVTPPKEETIPLNHNPSRVHNNHHYELLGLGPDQFNLDNHHIIVAKANAFFLTNGLDNKHNEIDYGSDAFVMSEI